MSEVWEYCRGDAIQGAHHHVFDLRNYGVNVHLTRHAPVIATARCYGTNILPLAALHAPTVLDHTSTRLTKEVAHTLRLPFDPRQARSLPLTCHGLTSDRVPPSLEAS